MARRSPSSHARPRHNGLRRIVRGQRAINRRGINPLPTKMGVYMQTPSAIILAGGRSSRMSRDKALLPLPGAHQGTFVEHLVSLMATHCPEVVLVARDGVQASQFALLTALAGHVQIITDVMPGGGPLMGLY